MDVREARRAEREARREMRERPVRTGDDPIARFLAAAAYGQSHPSKAAPPADETKPES